MTTTLLRALVAGALLGTSGITAWLAGYWIYAWRMRGQVDRN